MRKLFNNQLLCVCMCYRFDGFSSNMRRCARNVIMELLAPEVLDFRPLEPQCRHHCWGILLLSHRYTTETLDNTTSSPIPSSRNNGTWWVFLFYIPTITIISLSMPQVLLNWLKWRWVKEQHEMRYDIAWWYKIYEMVLLVLNEKLIDTNFNRRFFFNTN